MPSHQLEIKLIRNNTVHQVLTPDILSKEENQLELKTSSSIGEFPVASIVSKSQETNPLFMTFSKNDILQICVSSQGSPFTKIFEGEFLHKKTNLNNEKKTLEISVELTHSFFKLQFIDIKDKSVLSTKTLLEIISDFNELAKIPSIVNIASDVDQNINMAVGKQVNALQIIKMICLQKGLCITFKEDNSVLIENKKTKRAKIMGAGPVTTINESDVISMEMNE
jgi:hypothetical protein